MRAVFEEGTEIIVDSEAVTLGPGWSDVNSASIAARLGAAVTVSLHLNYTATAWVTKSKYALGAVVTESGKVYTLIKLEEAAEANKPTTSPTFWQEVAAPLVVCTLPADFRPAGEVNMIQSGLTSAKIATNGQISVGNLSPGDATISYAAAVAVP